MTFPALLISEELTPEARWRLVDGLYARVRPAIEGCGALAIVALTGWVRSRNPAFAAVLCGSLGVMAGRVVLARRYGAQGGRQLGSPTDWARRFTVAALATSSMWLPLNVAALGVHDPMLALFVMTVQSGWLGAAMTRNAASPAATFWQAVLVLPPSMACMVLSGDPFLYILVPFGAIQFSASMGISRAMAAQIVSTMRSEHALAAANARLTGLSATDGLTGIANRRAFDAALLAEWARAARDGTDLALLMIDVDWFKAYNDRYGHQAGDECLRLIAEAAVGAIGRPPDMAARFGGEEFVAVLPGTDMRGALDVAERMRQAVMALLVGHEGSPFGQVTISIGAASLSPHPGTDPQALIGLADQALYDAKHGGRNMVRGSGHDMRLGQWAPAPRC